MRILFVCNDNTFLSLIGEFVINEYYSLDHEAYSCGIVSGGRITSEKARVLAETNIDSLQARFSHINEFADEQFDCVIVFSKEALRFARMSIHPKPVFILVDEPPDDVIKCMKARDKVIDNIEHLFNIGVLG